MLCLLMPLTACADISGPQWLTGEPDPESLSQSSVVGKSQGETESSWPRLADVPEEKPHFSTQNQRATKAKDLMSDRLQADAERVRIRNIDLYGIEGNPAEAEKPFSFSALKP